MKGSFRQSMGWLHTWTGLVVGWILFFIFVTGTVSFANQEITRWMQPERPLKEAHAPDAVKQFDTAYHYLNNNKSSQAADSWTITFASDSRNSTVLSAGWSEPGAEKGRGKTVYLNSQDGTPIISQDDVRSTAGGRALMRMHFALQYISSDIAFIIVGICTMFMLVAIFTGIVAHKKFFKDFFTFRHSKGLRSWLDAHNIVSVAALPFFLMITYSGLLFFIYTYMPLGVPLTYGFEHEQQLSYYDELKEQTGSNYILGFGPGSGQRVLTELRSAAQGINNMPMQRQQREGVREQQRGEREAVVGQRSHRSEGNNTLGNQVDKFSNLAELVKKMQIEWGQNQIRAIRLSAANGNNPAKVQFSPAFVDSVMRGRNLGAIEFNAITGQRLVVEQGEIAFSEKFARTMLGLHEGLFAGPFVRWLYLISGFTGCLMIATGLILWTVKRRPKLKKTGQYAFGHAIVEKLNVTTIAGLSFSLAIYFMANRLIPFDTIDRAQWEINALFISWLLVLLYVLARPVMSAWRELLMLNTAIWLLLPVVNFITTDNHLISALLKSDWVIFSIDSVFIFLGVIFGWSAWKVHQKIVMDSVKELRRDSQYKNISSQAAR